jgi:ferrous iron transport protein B
VAFEFSVALAGNPNSGKSTIFNSLTGGRQHVGNWPGKTVERKEGVCRRDGYEIKLVDLPGTYSLTAYSIEEIIARDYIVNEHPDVVVDVVDASNLERNLYLAVQILELGGNLVIALNMSDLAASRGYKIDAAKLSEGLGGIPVVPTVASRGQGIPELLNSVIDIARAQPSEAAASPESTAQAQAP